MWTARTSCASTSTRSPAPSFTDAARIAGVAKQLLDELGLVGFPKTSGNRGVHIYLRIRPEWEFVDVRHAAIGFGRALERRDDGVTTKWWKEERGERVFVDFNQNCRDRTIASAVLAATHPRRAGEHPADLGRAGRGDRSRPRSTCSPCPTGWPTAIRGRRSTTWRTRWNRC